MLLLSVVGIVATFVQQIAPRIILLGMGLSAIFLGFAQTWTFPKVRREERGGEEERRRGAENRNTETTESSSSVALDRIGTFDGDEVQLLLTEPHVE